MSDELLLSEAEIERLSGGLTQPRRQLHELHERGFWRARLVRGQVILEREHYRAVCAGALPPGEPARDNPRTPQLRPIKRAA